VGGDNWINVRITSKISSIFLVVTLAFSQNVLFDDYNDFHDASEWSWLIDTLIHHGANVAFTSDVGWSTLSDMKLVWIKHPYLYYTEEEKGLLVNYSRNGGRIFIGGSQTYDATFILNDLLSEYTWEPTMQMGNQLTMPGNYPIEFITDFSPFTDNIEDLDLFVPRPIECGENAYPFAFFDSAHTEPVAAISMPFNSEGNCDSYIILVTGTHSFEDGEADFEDTYLFARNILLTMAGVDGYEFDPCAVPEPFEIEVDSVPECANPGDTITLTGRNLWQGSNENIGGDIEIYFYGPCDTVVIPFEYSHHRPDPHSLYNTWLKFICPDLPNGEYEIELGHKAITFYAGKITIPCETQYYPCTRIPNPFTPDGDTYNDEIYFTYPGIGESEGVIKIFNLRNIPVRTIEVPAGAGAKQSAKWDGTDNAGEPLLQGIYLYIIKSQGRIICKGTITLVR